MTQNWNEFVKEHLLKGSDTSKSLSGVCMSTKQGIPVFSHGELTYMKQTHMKYFLSLFNQACKYDTDMNESEVNLPGTRYKFKIIHRTFTSIYGTACDENRTGLIINLLPQGVLVCLFHHPLALQTAVKYVQCFCDKLCG